MTYNIVNLYPDNVSQGTTSNNKNQPEELVTAVQQHPDISGPTIAFFSNLLVQIFIGSIPLFPTYRRITAKL